MQKRPSRAVRESLDEGIHIPVPWDLNEGAIAKLNRHPNRIDRGLQCKSPNQIRRMVSTKVREKVAPVPAQDIIYPARINAATHASPLEAVPAQTNVR